MADVKEILRDGVGVVACSRARTTKSVVTLYRNDVQGMDDCDGECPYSVVCEEHGGVVAVHSQYAGRCMMAHPEGFCEDCQEAFDAALTEVAHG